jgi:hypothetical protein
VSCQGRFPLIPVPSCGSHDSLPVVSGHIRPDPAESDCRDYVPGGPNGGRIPARLATGKLQGGSAKAMKLWRRIEAGRVTQSVPPDAGTLAAARGKGLRPVVPAHLADALIALAVAVIGAGEAPWRARSGCRHGDPGRHGADPVCPAAVPRFGACGRGPARRRACRGGDIAGGRLHPDPDLFLQRRCPRRPAPGIRAGDGHGGAPMPCGRPGGCVPT